MIAILVTLVILVLIIVWLRRRRAPVKFNQIHNEGEGQW